MDYTSTLVTITLSYRPIVSVYDTSTLVIITLSYRPIDSVYYTSSLVTITLSYRPIVSAYWWLFFHVFMTFNFQCFKQFLWIKDPQTFRTEKLKVLINIYICRGVLDTACCKTFEDLKVVIRRHNLKTVK